MTCCKTTQEKILLGFPLEDADHKHVESCPACCALQNDTALFLNAAFPGGELDVPDTLDASIRFAARIRTPQKKQRRTRIVWGAVAAALLALLAVWPILQPGETLTNSGSFPPVASETKTPSFLDAASIDAEVTLFAAQVSENFNTETFDFSDETIWLASLENDLYACH